MQAESQGWDVAPGQGGCTGVQGPPRLTSKIGSEEKLAGWLSTVCPVSVAIRLATWLQRPGDRDLSDIPTIGRGTAGPPELRQRPEVQLTGRSVSGSASLRSSQSYRPSSRHQAARSAAMLAASTQPQFTSQVFDGKLRRPIDFAVRTPSSTTACWRCSTPVNWAWWLPGTPPIPPAAGMLVTMMEYRHPVARSKAVRFPACRREGLVRRTTHRSPEGHPAARLVRWVISATCLSSCTAPSWSTAACQAVTGSSLIACSSAPVMAQPQVNSTVRRLDDNDSRWVMSSWLAP